MIAVHVQKCLLKICFRLFVGSRSVERIHGFAMEKKSGADSFETIKLEDSRSDSNCDPSWVFVCSGEVSSGPPAVENHDTARERTVSKDGPITSALKLGSRFQTVWRYLLDSKVEQRPRKNESAKAAPHVVVVFSKICPDSVLVVSMG